MKVLIIEKDGKYLDRVRPKDEQDFKWYENFYKRFGCETERVEEK